MKLAFALLVMSLLISAQSYATPPQLVDYMVNCQGCHLSDGRGFPEKNVPDMRGKLAKFLQVEGGREYIIQVPGLAQSDLDDKALARLINWMMIAFSPDQIPNDFIAYTPHEVAALRQKPLTNVTEVRTALIKKIKEYETTH